MVFKRYPCTPSGMALGLKEVEATTSRYMNLVSLSALRTGRLYPPRGTPCYSFLLEAESTPGPNCEQKDKVN